MARKISPSDHCFSGPAGVRFDDTKEPRRGERSLPTSKPPVSVPVLEWHAPQKLLAIASPRRICSLSASTFRLGAGASRKCILRSPATATPLIRHRATISRLAATDPAHRTARRLARQARKPSHASSIAAAIKIADMMRLDISPAEFFSGSRRVVLSENYCGKVWVVALRENCENRSSKLQM